MDAMEDFTSDMAAAQMSEMPPKRTVPKDAPGTARPVRGPDAFERESEGHGHEWPQSGSAAHAHESHDFEAGDAVNGDARGQLEADADRETEVDMDDEAEVDSAVSDREPGLSPLAIPAAKMWDAADRPSGWIGRVYGLVVHTTGGGLPSRARKKKVYHTVAAVDHYNESHGCHYVLGWRGIDGGDLLQVANERELAAGVGVTNPQDPGKDQRRSINRGRFEKDLPAVLVRHWRARWPGRQHSLELLPGTRTANAPYIHCECVPCVYHHAGKLVTDAPPLRPGLRFTKAQHDSVARLAVDIARRNGWPATENWWRTPRLLGHEDLTPISRHDSKGGWDPGYLRDEPYFDWDHVYAEIERLLSKRTHSAPEPELIES